MQPPPHSMAAAAGSGDAEGGVPPSLAQRVLALAAELDSALTITNTTADTEATHSTLTAFCVFVLML